MIYITTGHGQRVLLGDCKIFTPDFSDYEHQKRTVPTLKPLCKSNLGWCSFLFGSCNIIAATHVVSY